MLFARQDGDLDVAIIARFSLEAVVHFENQRDGELWHRRPLTLSLTRPTAVSWADLDSDGFLDLVRANLTALQAVPPFLVSLTFIDKARGGDSSFTGDCCCCAYCCSYCCHVAVFGLRGSFRP